MAKRTADAIDLLLVFSMLNVIIGIIICDVIIPVGENTSHIILKKIFLESIGTIICCVSFAGMLLL